jgi:hypothetical protein
LDNHDNNNRRGILVVHIQYLNDEVASVVAVVASVVAVVASVVAVVASVVAVVASVVVVD